ncbi:MarR family transcriptional regulator [Amycolatopsis acidiphila]|uniref:MarR family winged helix-turn-helix transcriptional regulator n=1 Tax=Amycolatopsis acidiphila TaxID=715473 RepID=UPI001C945D6E|nr:MarR family transcriptional regulator [Amycolatopsis acidiphila]UIJ59036.1 MarR family transcriptional regulator [Amycolatopsis acidiphila]
MSTHVDPDRSPGFALKRLQQALRARMDAALADLGLTSPHYAVLGLLAEHPGISNAELARRSFVAPPTMLRFLTTLSEAGLIVRADRTPDQRSRRTTLTAKGRARLAEAAVRVQELDGILADEAGPRQDVIMAWLRACAERLAP